MSTREPSNFLLSAEEKFNSSNWLEFKHTILAAVKARGMTPYLTGSLPRPTAAIATDTPNQTLYWGVT